MDLVSPSLAFYLNSSETGLSCRPDVWQRRRLITRSASARLGYLPTTVTDVLGSRDSRINTPRQQLPISRPLVRLREPPARLDVGDVLLCAETYCTSASERHRLEVLEQVQRAVRHEAFTSPPESQPNTGLLVPMATVPPETVSRPTADAWTQTEPTRCHLPLTLDRLADQQSDTNQLFTQHNGSSPLIVPGQIYPAFSCTCHDKLAKDYHRSPKATDVSVTQKAFNPRLVHLSVLNASTKVSASKADTETNLTFDEKGAATCLTPQTKHVCNDNTQAHTTSTDRVTQTDAENTASGDKAAVTRNKRHVSFSRSYSENFPQSSSRLLFQGQPSTPLFFTNLQHMQWKIATGQVDRKIYMNRCQQEPARIRSVVSAGAIFKRGHHMW